MTGGTQALVETRTFRIDFGYEGTAFVGSQRQPGERTVQGELERAVSQVCGGEPARLALAGRTDRGVHAVGQVASGQIPWRRSPAELERALRACTPDDISVYRVQVADSTFHARFSARSREYRYRIWNGPVPPTLLRRFVWAVRAPLDVAAMNDAARSLCGRRDFASLAGSGKGVPGAGVDTVRTVTSAGWQVVPSVLERNDQGSRLLEFQIRADGFLAQMVRNVVGSLVTIGRGEQPVAWLERLLSARDRRLGPAPAPPQGLALWRVHYAEDDGEGVTSDADAATAMRVEGDEDILAESI